MIPVIALVGRPNVGKSTLFNKLTRTRDALVARYPGLTRDRQYGKGALGDKNFIVIDTGGLSGKDTGIDAPMADQSLAAIDEANLVLFMVDSRVGRTGGDEVIGQLLREESKKVVLVANKIDGQDPDFIKSEFFSLGFGEPQLIAAVHGQGVSALIQHTLDILSASDINVDEEPASAARGIKIAVIGRPNVGKSTLVNRMLGEQRVVVFDEPGTTRDSIYIPYKRGEKSYTLIDTAGVRRRGKVGLTVEKFSVIKTLEAIQDTNVIILMLDARDGLVEQDLHLLGYALDAGRALVIAINKWDGTTQLQKTHIRSELERRLVFLDFAKMHYISALHGSGVGNLYASIDKAHESATRKFKTNELNQILKKAVTAHAPPLVHGRRIKLRYAHLGGSNPPVIVVHGNQTASVPDAYQRYLQHQFIKELKLEGTPVRLEFKTSDNPYAGRKNRLTPRQISKKRRLISHVKKVAKKKKRS
ncbi:MAG: ribosome biogenesis GTPase Der [Gammaproteobacteria bacterium]|nr:ribosome biogenesis GTPase Der [Gammaproteobacteria bacterium]